MRHSDETSTTLLRWRRGLLCLAVGSSLLLGGCDEVGVDGVGASVGLPSAFVSSTTDPTDIGVGNTHWVGNPRW